MSELGGIWGHDDQAHCLGGPIERAVDYMLAKAGSDMSHADALERLLVVMEHLYVEQPLVWRPGARALISETSTPGSPRRWSPPRGGGSSTWSRPLRSSATWVDARSP